MINQSFRCKSLLLPLIYDILICDRKQKTIKKQKKSPAVTKDAPTTSLNMDLFNTDLAVEQIAALQTEQDRQAEQRKL